MADTILAWAATHIGRVRAHNEDCCRMPSWQSGDADECWNGRIDRRASWAVVADGMGGHGAGEVASRTAAAALAASLDHVVNEADAEGAVQLANSRVHDAMTQPGGRPAMGSTVVGARLVDDRCIVFNVGDSRAYLLRRATLAMLSVDHTPTAGRTGSARSHALTQSLGGTLTRRPLAPHVCTFYPEACDRLLLCTDGLTDLVAESVISKLTHANVGHPAVELVSEALAAGGRDNVTAVVLEF